MERETMTNEELAVMIQGGQADLVPTLWEQVQQMFEKAGAMN